MNTFHLRILAPERTFFDGACASLTMPTIDGMYGVMAQHEDVVIAIVPGKLTTAYDSAVVRGRTLVVCDAEEKWHALRLLVQTLDPVSVEKAHMCSQQSMERTMIVKLVPEEITGKQGKGDD